MTPFIAIFLIVTVLIGVGTWFGYLGDQKIKASRTNYVDKDFLEYFDKSIPTEIPSTVLSKFREWISDPDFPLLPEDKIKTVLRIDEDDFVDVCENILYELSISDQKIETFFSEKKPETFKDLVILIHKVNQR